MELGEPLERSASQLAEGCITLAVPRRAVPAITVVGRRVAPFRFGRPIGSGEQWLRTCLAEPVPGRFLTQRGWRDPFDPLAAEDPSGAAVVAVLAQEGSGPAGGRRPPGDDGGLLVEGVAGFGDDFMLGRAAPTPLPEHGLDDVRRVGPAPRPPRPGPLRRAHVGHDAWVLRLQLATVAASATSVYPGVPSRWHRFDPSLGLQRLRDLIASVGRDEGIEVTGDVGVSSHAGDLLRRAPCHPGCQRRPGPALNFGIRPRHVIMPRPLVVSKITIKA